MNAVNICVEIGVKMTSPHLENVNETCVTIFVAVELLKDTFTTLSTLLLSGEWGWDLNRDNETSVTRPTRPKFDLSHKPDLFNLITKATTKFSNRLQNRRHVFRIDYKADEGIL